MLTLLRLDLKNRITIALILVFCLCGSAQSQSINIPPIDIDLSLKQVSKHVYYAEGLAGIGTDNKGFVSNASVIVTKKGIIVFDALGSPSLAKKLKEAIQRISAQPIKKIFISHYHADHFYGLQGLVQTGTETYAPAGAKRYLSRDGAEIRLNERRKSLKPWVNETTQLIPPQHYIDQDLKFSFGGLDIQVLHFGSTHSDGDIVMFIEQDKVLLTGDLIFTGRIPFIGGNDLIGWQKRIDELAKLPAQWIIPGHGSAFKNFELGSNLTKSYLNLVHSVMKAGVEDLMSFEEIYQATDWSAYEKLPAFNPGNRINAYRVFLNAEKEALDAE